MEETMLDSEALALSAITPMRSRGLTVVQDLLKRLHEAEIVYCHWKGNEHLDDAFAGRTDLDVLVERGRSADLQTVLADSGFRCFVARPSRAQPGVEDYLGFDPATGRLVHLHLHYRLPVGQKHFTDFRLPWEERLLTTRVFDAHHGIYVTNPCLELLLLLVRAALKRRQRDWFKRQSLMAQDRFTREFAWLRDQVNTDSVCSLSSALLGPRTEKPLRQLLAEPERSEHLQAFMSAIHPMMSRYRTHGPLVSTLLAWLREVQWLADAVNRRYLHCPVPLRRVSPRGGSVIVLLGSDGSGKSSLGKTLAEWLGAKLDVMPIYFGSGDGPSSMIRLPLVLTRRLLALLLSKDTNAKPFSREGGASPSPNTSRMRPQRALRALALVPWALALSLEKRTKLRRMAKARNLGMIVVCDRFAQADIPGFNDGPLLTHWNRSRWRICRAVAAWEAKPHQETKFDPPDLVLKLNVTPEVALTRRPDMSLEEIRRRVQAVQSLKFPASAKVVEVGTDVKFDEVVLAAKRIVWDQI